MLSVTSVNGYNPYFKANSDNEAKKVPMRAVSRRAQQPKDERSEYEKKVRRAKISRYVSLGSSILLAAAFATMAVVGVKQYKLQKIQTAMMDMANKELPANWGDFLNIVSKDDIAKHRGFDELVQHPEVKELWDDMLHLINHSDFFNRSGKNSGLALLLYGPPGTGKTEAVYALAKKFGDDAILNLIDCNALKDKWFGGSEGKIINSLKAATELCKENPNKKIIVLVDEFTIANKSNGHNDQLITDMQDAFKAHLTDLIAQPNAIVVATTNHGTKGVPLNTFMDDALVSRFALQKYFPNPITDQFDKVFESYISILEKNNQVEKGFYTKHKAKIHELSQKMQDGEASFRSFWSGVTKKIELVAARRFDSQKLSGDARKISIDDFENAVEFCKKEGNWGVKLEEKGFDFEDLLQAMLAAMSKNNGAA